MKLTYRGTSYEYNPPTVETSTSETVGKYRGLDWRFRNPQKALILESNLDMKYRGAAYPVATPDAVATTPAEVPATLTAVISVADRARMLMMNHHRTIKQRQQGMLTRLAVEVGISTDDANHYWNHIQGKVHPSFRVDYDRSNVAFS